MAGSLFSSLVLRFGSIPQAQVLVHPFGRQESISRGALLTLLDSVSRMFCTSAAMNLQTYRGYFVLEMQLGSVVCQKIRNIIDNKLDHI